MYRLILSAVLSLATVSAPAAPHQDRAPLPAEVVQAVRAAQHGQADPLAVAIDRHLHESLDIGQRSGRGALKIGKTLQTATSPTALNDRRTEAAAKRQQWLLLRDEVLGRLAMDAQTREAQGDSASAHRTRQLQQKLAARFDALTQDLDQLARATNQAELGIRAQRLSKRVADWLATRPAEHLPQPNWRQATPQPPVKLPAAKHAPGLVADAWRLKQQAAEGGALAVALRATPPEALACSYVAADVADSSEAPKTHPDIVALAKQLDYEPLRMFEWVNQNVKFEPYYGSLKGGLGALWSQSGGATDQASLLIALLRAANIPARYVRGNISVLDITPKGADGRGPRWIGAKSYQAASAILAGNGNPAAAYRNEGIDLAHVWVEACLPYAAYRGTGLDDSGHRWVPLDPAYKDRRYVPGIGVDASFDFDYPTWLASRLDSQGRYRLPQEQLDDAVEAHAKTKAPNFANNTVEDVPYQAQTKRRHFDVLPIVPPYEVMQYTSWDGVAGGSAETAALPDRHRYRLQVAVRNKSGTADPLAGNLLAQKTLNLFDLASKRLTLSFNGATAGDQSAFDSWINGVDPAANPTCAATANMVPVLKLEGSQQALDAGAGSTPLCSGDNVLHMKVTLGELVNPVSETYYTNIKAASLHALHAYAWHTSDTFLAKRVEQLLTAVRANPGNPNADRDGIEGEFLNLAASKYSRYVADAGKRAGELFGESGTMGISLGLTSAQVKINYLFDLPYGLFRKGFLIDWPGSISTSSRLDTPSATDKRAFKMTGFAASAYEAYIWQEVAQLDAVSTTRGLQFAKEQNVEILQINNATDWANQKCKLDNSCANGTLNTNPAGLNYSASHIGQIESTYVNQGYKLTLPRRLIQYPDASGWLGAAFYAENFTSSPARASFPINGYSGGVTIEPAGNNTGSTGSGSGSGGGFAQGTPSLGNYFPNTAQQGNGSLLGLTIVNGDPVNMVTGNLIHSERDISIKGRGGLPIVFERWYNSKDAKDGPLGFGWTHSFNHFLRFYGVEGGQAKLAWSDGTGGERFFTTANHSSGNINAGATFAGTAGVYATLERLSGGNYRLTERSGMVYLFENISAGATDTGLKARLLSITDRNSNALTLSYTPITGCSGTFVCKVTDSLNRALTFSYTNSRITQIQDFTGRTWQYAYDGNGDLVTFKNPLAVSGSQNPVTYQYYSTVDGPKHPHALKQYKLPRGNGMRFEYYANGRVFRHTPFDTAGNLKTDHATTFTWAEFRRESRTTDALGRTRVFFFDAYGNPLSITDEAGAETAYTYDTTAGRTHLRLTKTDPAGMTTNYAYDALGNLSDVTLPSGRSLQYRDHTVFGQPKRIKDADGNWTLNRFDAQGFLTDTVKLKNAIAPLADTRPANADIVAWTQIQADSVGNPIKTRTLRDWTSAVLGDAASGVGPSLETAYDANKLNPISLTRRGDKDGTPGTLETDVYSDFQFDALGRMTRGPDANWYAADFQYDALDRLTKSPDGRGHQWASVYDANGNPLMVGLSVNGSYLDGYYAAWDDLDRIERRVDYAGNATLTRYNPLGHISQISEADGYSIGFDRDPLGRITGAYNQEGHRVSLSLDAEGRPRSVTDPNNLTTVYDYYHASQDGRLKKTTLPTVTGQAQGRAVEVASYDGYGRPTRINSIAADGSLRDSYRFYDELGRLTRAVGPRVSATDTSRPVTCYVYSPLSDIKEIWAGATTDTVTKVCNLADASLKKQVTRSYDDFGRKLTEIDQNGKVWKWTWNVHNELTASQTPAQIVAGQSTTYSYGVKTNPGETQGQLKQRSVPGTNGQTAVYTRDALGFVTQAETKNAANQTVVAYNYSYDPAKRLKSVTDSRGNKTLTYTWTPGGRLAQLQDSDGHSASFAYDATGRLASVTAPNNETIAFTYDAGGRLIETRLASGQKTSQTWFEDGSLKQKQNLFNTTTLSNHLYTLDSQGRRATQAETVNGLTTNWSYGYDNLDRLTSASDGTAETYGYDIFGNRRSKTKSATTTAYLYDAAHQLSEIRSGSDTGTLIGAAVHDADGHLTKLCENGTVTKTTSDCTATGAGATTLQLVWNALEHLNTATRTGIGAITESYTYDDSGRRIKKTSGSTTTSYLYNGDDIHAEWNGAISGSPAAVYTHGANIDEPLLRLTGATNGPGATQAAYLQDGLGSVVGIANITGTLTANQRFDAWGNRIAPSGSVPQYGYTGREPDATGLTFYRARYYHPGIARFASRDPMGMVDAVSPYAYVGNSPTNFVDPTGEFLNFVGGAIANVAIGGAIRMATGGSFWDAGGIATDLAVGAVTSGAGALASLRHLRNLENAVASGTRFTGSVQGVAQITGRGTNIDHGVRSVFEAQKLVRAQGGTAYLDASVSKLGITGTARNYRPDVLHQAAKGRINTVEVASVSQQSGNARRYLDVKTDDIGNAVTSRGGSFSGDVIEYGNARVGVGEVYNAFYGGYVNSVLLGYQGYQGLQAFTASQSPAAPYSGSNSAGARPGK